MISSAQQCRLAERNGQKIVLQRQFADLSVKRVHIDGRPRRFHLLSITENSRSSLKELVFPMLDLIVMHVKLLRQSHQSLLSSDGASATFALKAGL